MSGAVALDLPIRACRQCDERVQSRGSRFVRGHNRRLDAVNNKKAAADGEGARLEPTRGQHKRQSKAHIDARNATRRTNGAQERTVTALVDAGVKESRTPSGRALRSLNNYLRAKRVTTLDGLSQVLPKWASKTGRRIDLSVAEVLEIWAPALEQRGIPHPAATADLLAPAYSPLDPEAFDTFVSWLATLLSTLQLSPKQLSVEAGLSILVCDRLLQGRPPAPKTITALAPFADVDRAALARLATPVQGIESTLRPVAAEIERKRRADGLRHSEVVEALDLCTKGYWDLRHRPEMQLSLLTRGRIANWLGISGDEMLRLEGHWDGLSPISRIVTGAMLDHMLTQAQLSRLSDVHANTVSSVLSGARAPTDEVLKKLATAFPVDVAVLRRAASEMKQARPPQPPRGKIARVIRRDGRIGIRRWGDESYGRSGLWQRSTEQRSEDGRAGAQATRDRWSVLHLSPRPSGQFGLCRRRACGRMTQLSAAAIKQGRVAEYHAGCMAESRASDPRFAAWGFSEPVASTKRQFRGAAYGTISVW
jgi:transcriptional regulator with XRE-family HTH domain